MLERRHRILAECFYVVRAYNYLGPSPVALDEPEPEPELTIVFPPLHASSPRSGAPPEALAPSPYSPTPHHPPYPRTPPAGTGYSAMDHQYVRNYTQQAFLSRYPAPTALTVGRPDDHGLSDSFTPSSSPAASPRFKDAGPAAAEQRGLQKPGLSLTIKSATPSSPIASLASPHKKVRPIGTLPQGARTPVTGSQDKIAALTCSGAGLDNAEVDRAAAGYFGVSAWQG